MSRQKENTAPPISRLVIEWLAGLYPNRVPGIDMTDREIWIAVGRQEVIRKLNDEHKRQTNPSENDG